MSSSELAPDYIIVLVFLLLLLFPGLDPGCFLAGITIPNSNMKLISFSIAVEIICVTGITCGH